MCAAVSAGPARHATIVRCRIVASAAAACLAIAGCGKTLTVEQSSGPIASVGPQGAGGLVTKNTTRLGGSSAAVDAAAIAQAVYPGESRAGRPQTVVLVDAGDWPAALAASTLAGAPLHAPLLYTEGSALPAAGATALSTMRPTGAPALAGAQTLSIGTAAPSGYRSSEISPRNAAQLAVAVERLSSSLRRAAPSKLIVTAEQAPPAMTAPAAGLAAQAGAPILFVERDAIPRATLMELTRLKHASIYVIGPSRVVSEAVVAQLGRFGPVTRISGSDPASNAVAVARFTDGSFGWGVEEAGHGFVFANPSRPLDGPASAPLAASGDYAPLLLLDSSGGISRAVGEYVGDLQPGYPPSGPVHGVYNHGWLIGDQRAIPLATQARLDGMLEITSRRAAGEPTAPELETSTPTTPTGP
jgi:ell wall binding domain 2 (CWB2)